MKKLLDVLLVAVCTAVIVVIGCRSLLDQVTPANINSRSLDYAEVEPNDVGFPSLADAKNVKIEIIVKHRDTQIDLKRIAQDDQLAYRDALGFIDASIAEAEYKQELMIGDEDNPFSIIGILMSLGLGGMGVSIGRRYLKRPGDYTPEEHDADCICAYDEGKNGSSTNS